MSDTSTLNAIIVGAGLAGLACAADLAAAGAAVRAVACPPAANAPGTVLGYVPGEGPAAPGRC